MVTIWCGLLLLFLVLFVSDDKYAWQEGMSFLLGCGLVCWAAAYIIIHAMQALSAT